MLSEPYILDQFAKRPPAEQVDILLAALDHMKADAARSRAQCIALAMGIPLFPKVQAVTGADGYRLQLLFDNGETRTVDFRAFLRPGRRAEQQLLDDYEAFRAVEVVDGTLSWPAVGVTSRDSQGVERFYAYDVDPGVLYEVSE